jgi:uncharacterized Ntn-hydrolase superfamily protein
VLEAVATTFEAGAASGRHLADRLIEALAAGHAAGGDARKGRAQSAAVVVADARPGMSRRPDGITANINVCEHPTPVAELRRIYDAISETLGFRELQQFAGSDVYQLRVMLHALGKYHQDVASHRGAASPWCTRRISWTRWMRSGRRSGSRRRRRIAAGIRGRGVLTRAWRGAEAAGKADTVRAQLRQVTQVRR